MKALTVCVCAYVLPMKMIYSYHSQRRITRHGEDERADISTKEKTHVLYIQSSHTMHECIIYFTSRAMMLLRSVSCAEHFQRGITSTSEIYGSQFTQPPIQQTLSPRQQHQQSKKRPPLRKKNYTYRFCRSFHLVRISLTTKFAHFILLITNIRNVQKREKNHPYFVQFR